MRVIELYAKKFSRKTGRYNCCVQLRGKESRRRKKSAYAASCSRREKGRSFLKAIGNVLTDRRVLAVLYSLIKGKGMGAAKAHY